MLTSITNMLNHTTRAIVWLAGAIWAMLTPTVPYILICFFAIILDCFSAWRLAGRVKRQHPGANDGKFKSSYARRIFNTFLTISSLVVLAYLMDTYIFTFATLYLANVIAGAFCALQLLSILENESSENNNTWARTLQKILVNKAERHFNIDIDKLKDTKQ